MRSVTVDKFALGDIAEECGLTIQTNPDPYGRDTHVELSIDILAGRGRIKLRAISDKSIAVIPPEFRFCHE